MKPRNYYERLQIPVGGGLNLADAPAHLGEGEATRMVNLVVAGSGRVGPRRAAVSLGTLTGIVVAAIPFPFGEYETDHRRGGFLVVYDPGTQEVRLHNVDISALNPVGSVLVWEGVESSPRVSYAILNRRVFISEEGRRHPMVIIDLGEGGAINTFVPEFLFGDDDEATRMPMHPSLTVEYNNMVFTSGYGAEGGYEDRPEMVRFSYLGLQRQGSDDEDDAGTGDSANLFDREHAFMVGERGEPVVSMGAASGRLIIAKANAAYMLFGYGADSFSLELIGNNLGSTSSRGMIAAAGRVWWMSPLGPVYWDGQLHNISRKVDPLRPELQDPRVFASHSPSDKEVRWHFGFLGDSMGAERYLAFNYELGVWYEGAHSLPLFGTGWISPYWGDVSDAEVTPPGPSGSPTNLQHVQVMSSSALAMWQNGDITPGTETEVRRKRTMDPESAFQVVATLPSGSANYLHTNLISQTSYDVVVAHKRNGKYSNTSANTFMTANADAPPLSPTNLRGSYVFTALPNFGYRREAVIAWNSSSSDHFTQLWASDAQGSLLEMLVEVQPGLQGHTDVWPSGTTSRHYVARHRDTGGRLSAVSNTVFIVANDPPDFPL